jgi:hypothetical protein
MRPLPLALVVGFALGAADARAATPVLDCAHAVRPFGQPRASVVVAGVTFRGLRDAAAQRFPSTQQFRSMVTVPAGRPVTVTVAEPWLSLQYGTQRNDGGPLRVSEGHRRLRFAPCTRATSWAGGFIVAHAGCATLRVRRDGGHWARARVGFGRRCR